jgi:glycosyltransferase involved in cell wall biosynthesis
MKLLLIHPTFHPVPGGIEGTMRLHAESLSRLGHEVTVLTGEGTASLDSYKVVAVPELAPSFPLNLQVKKAVDHGQTDAYLNQFTSALLKILETHAAGADAILVHGALTTHHNLALTQALWLLSKTRKLIAWAHDFSPTNQDHSIPLPDRMPWAMMRKANPQVTYVAPTQTRQGELCTVLGLKPEQVPIIPNPVAPESVLGIPATLARWLEERKLYERDVVFYYPSRVLMRKNLDLAIQMVHGIKSAGLSAALLATATPDPYSPSSQQYLGYLTATIQQLGLQDDVHFMSQTLDWTEAMWSAGFRVADVLLFPSKYEAFGLPVAEAALARLPVWRLELPVVGEVDAGIATLVRDPAEAAAAVAELLQVPEHQLRKRILRYLNPHRIAQEKILPLLKRVAS